MTLEDRFAQAQKRIQSLSERPSNEDLLALYSYFKQATVGDAEGKRPGMLDLKGRAKYDAWASRRGINKDDAMDEYIAIVARLCGDD